MAKIICSNLMSYDQKDKRMQHNLCSGTIIRSVVLSFFLSIVKVSQKNPHRDRHARYMFRGDHEKMCTYYLRCDGTVQRFTRGIILEVGARWWLLCTAETQPQGSHVYSYFVSQPTWAHSSSRWIWGGSEGSLMEVLLVVVFSPTLVQTLCVLLYRQIPGWCRCVSAVLE